MCRPQVNYELSSYCHHYVGTSFVSFHPLLGEFEKKIDSLLRVCESLKIYVFDFEEDYRSSFKMVDRIDALCGDGLHLLYLQP